MRIGAILLVASATTGCVNIGMYDPIVDVKNVDLAQLERDKQECRAYAAGPSPAASAVDGAIAGAAIGAAIGALTGAPLGEAGYGAGAGAGMGAAMGAVSNTNNNLGAQMEIIRNCLKGRGYAVLF